MAAPPQAEMALVVGKYKVPVTRQLLTSIDGDVTTFNMLTLSQRHQGSVSTSWLINSLGNTHPAGSYQRFQSSYHRFPLVQEIMMAVKAKRMKRKRTGYFEAADGAALVPSSLIEITVRGRVLHALNSTRPLAIDVGSSTEVVNWFLAEVWHDLHAVAPELGYSSSTHDEEPDGSSDHDGEPASVDNA